MLTTKDILKIKLTKSAYFYKIKDGWEVDANLWNTVSDKLKSHVVQPIYNFVKTSWNEIDLNNGELVHYGLCVFRYAAMLIMLLTIGVGQMLG